MTGGLNVTLVGDKLFLGGYGNYLPANPITLETQIESFRYILCAIYATYAWEHIVTLPIEISRWKQLLMKRQIVTVNLCVLISRYISWTNAIASAVFFFANPVSCQATFTWIFLSYALIWALTAIIFVIRVQSLYPGNRFLHIFVWTVFGIVSIMWIVSLGFFYSDRLPEPYWSPRHPQCTASPSPYVHVIGFGGSMCFDILILILTVYSATNNFASRKSTHGVLSAQKWLLETAVIYALVCFTCNASTFFVWIFQKNVLLRAYTIPFAIVVNPIVASRIVFHGATWGSKTVLLESRLVKITQDDVANWQRDPGVLGAPSSRRPSHTHVQLPTKGNRYAKPSRINQDDQEAVELKDERLGFDGIFITKPGRYRHEENGSDSADESDLEKGSSFRRPFGDIIAPQRAARRKARRLSSQRSEIVPKPTTTTTKSSNLDIESDQTSTPTSSYDAPHLLSSSTTSETIVDPIRRDSNTNSILTANGTDYETLQDTIPAPRGWTVQEMLNEENNDTRHNSRDRQFENQRSSFTNQQQQPNRVVISQHVTTQVD